MLVKMSSSRSSPVTPSSMTLSEQALQEIASTHSKTLNMLENHDMEQDEETLGTEQARSHDLEHICGKCSKLFQSPRALSCLHVYCEACMEKLLAEREQSGIITCPECSQETKVDRKGVPGLSPDYVLQNIMDMNAIENMQIGCTSCKAKEKAVARCSDCANFLCPNCVTAHQYMRCFENHKVSHFFSTDLNTIHVQVYMCNLKEN